MACQVLRSCKKLVNNNYSCPHDAKIERKFLGTKTCYLYKALWKDPECDYLLIH